MTRFKTREALGKGKKNQLLKGIKMSLSEDDRDS